MESTEVEEIAKYTDPVVTLNSPTETMFYGSKVLIIKASKVDKDNVRSMGSIRLCHEATSNCQMTILGGAHYINNVAYTRKQREKLLSDICSYVGTNCVLVDVLEESYDAFLEAIHDNDFTILTDTGYTNPTGSELHLIYFQINEYEDPDDGWDDDEDDGEW